MELKKQELLQIEGGAITATLINSLARAVNTMLNLGRSVGSAIRRIYKGKVCSL